MSMQQDPIFSKLEAEALSHMSFGQESAEKAAQARRQLAAEPRTKALEAVRQELIRILDDRATFEILGHLPRDTAQGYTLLSLESNEWRKTNERKSACPEALYLLVPREPILAEAPVGTYGAKWNRTSYGLCINKESVLVELKEPVLIRSCDNHTKVTVRSLSEAALDIIDPRREWRNDGFDRPVTYTDGTIIERYRERVREAVEPHELVAGLPSRLPGNFFGAPFITFTRAAELKPSVDYRFETLVHERR